MLENAPMQFLPECSDCGDKKHKKIDIMYKVNTWYALTVCPSNNSGECKPRRRKPSSPAREQLSYHRERLYNYLLPMNDTEYKIWTDISEPREINMDHRPRIHFHGVIRFKTNEAILDWLLTHAPTIMCCIGILKVDTLKCPKYWLEYCQKYVHITRQKPLVTPEAKLT